MRKQYPYLEDAYYENAIIATKKRNFLSKLNDLVIQKQYVRITLLNWEEEPLKEISGQITSGSITKDGSAAMRTTGNMTATFSAGDYTVEDAQADFALNKKIYIEIGLRNDTGEYEDYPILWFPQGVFFIGSFSISSTTGGVNISLSLKDKMAGLNGDVGGKFSSTTILDTVDDIDDEGNYSSQKVLLYDLIMELVNHFGGEPLNNIVIEDVDLQIKRIMKWNGDTPLYIWESTGFENSDTTGSGSGTELNEKTGTAKSFTVTTDQPQSGIATYRAYDVGADVGYILDDFYYSSDLTAAPGDSVVTILDKIKSYLGNYEYFYDIYGIFHFREIKNYLNTTQAKTLLKDMSKNDYLVETTTSKSAFSFSDDSNLISITSSPQYDSIKNDFIIQGKRQSTTDATYPVMYHLAIDNKPTTGAVSYEGFCLYQNEDEDTIEGAFPTVIDDELPIPGDASRKFLVREDLLHGAGYDRVDKQEKVNNSLNMLKEYKEFFDRDENVTGQEKELEDYSSRVESIISQSNDTLTEIMNDAKSYRAMIKEDSEEIAALSESLNTKSEIVLAKTPGALAEALFNTEDMCNMVNTFLAELWSGDGGAYGCASMFYTPNNDLQLNNRWSLKLRQQVYGKTDFSAIVSDDKDEIKFNPPKESDSLGLFSYALYDEIPGKNNTFTYSKNNSFYPEWIRKNSIDTSLIKAGPAQKWYVPKDKSVNSGVPNSIWGAIPLMKENSHLGDTYVTNELTPGSNALYEFGNDGSVSLTKLTDSTYVRYATGAWKDIKTAIEGIDDIHYIAIFLNPYYESFPLNIREKACKVALEYNQTYLNQLAMEEAAKERGGSAWSGCFGQDGSYEVVKKILTLDKDYEIEERTNSLIKAIGEELQYLYQVKNSIYVFLGGKFRANGGGYLDKAIEKYKGGTESAEINTILDKEGSALANLRKKIDTILVSKDGVTRDSDGLLTEIKHTAGKYDSSNNSYTLGKFTKGNDDDVNWILALLDYNNVYKDYPLSGMEVVSFNSDNVTRNQISLRPYLYYYGKNVTELPQSTFANSLALYKDIIANTKTIIDNAKISSCDLLYSIFVKWMDDYRQLSSDGNSVVIEPQTNVEQLIYDGFAAQQKDTTNQNAKRDMYNNIRSYCSEYTNLIEGCTEKLTTLFDSFIEDKKNSGNYIVTSPGKTPTLKDEFLDKYVDKVKEIYLGICIFDDDNSWNSIKTSVRDYLKTTTNSSVQMAEAVKGLFETTKKEIALLDSVSDNTSSYTKITQDDADKQYYGLVQWSDSCYKFIPIIKYYGKGYGYVCKDWRTEIYVRGMMAKDSNYGTDASQYYENLVSKVTSSEMNELSEATKNMIVVAHNDSVNVDFYFEELQAFWPQIYDLLRQEFIGDQESTEYKYSSLTTGNYYLDFIDANSTELNDFSIGNIGRRTDVISDDNINCLFEPEIPDILYVNTDESSAEQREQTLQQCQELGYGYVQIPGNLYYAMYTGGNHNAAFDQIKYELYIHTLYQKTLSITAIPAWFLQPNTRCTIDDKATNTYGDFNIKSITLTLGAGSTMSVTLNEALERI